MRLAVCAEMVFLDLPITERVQRIAEAGFDAEIWDWTRHDVEALAATGAMFSSMTGYVRGDFGDGADELVRTARESIAVAETLDCPRLNLHGTGLDGKGLPVVPGEEMPGPLWISAARTLTRLGEMAERAGVTFCLENLNTAVDHPGVPFARAADTIALVEAVGHPRVRLMLDLYHAQIGEGNLIELVRRAGPLIGEIQVADVPGRCEPGTGEINYPAIAAALDGMGYDGTVGLEAWAADGDSDRALDRFRAAFTDRGGKGLCGGSGTPWGTKSSTKAESSTFSAVAIACETALMEDVAARTLGRVAANGIELAYETFGEAGAPPVVLIMGLATQMIAWPDELCEGLARHGLFVVRFDNRDVGESTHLRDLPPPRLADIVVRRRPPPYSIGDMAADVAGLIDGLGLGAVHLVGASMGGFIAQTFALEHPARVRTLTLIMTSTGSRRVGQPKPRVYARLLRRRGADGRPGAVAAAAETFRLIGSHGFAFDEQYVREVAGRSWDRGYDPDGFRRQLAASASQPNRTADLRRITVPALVMHGLHDPLVAPSGGLAIARAIPGSRFVGFSGMGHDLPRALWPEFVTQIAALAAQGEQRRHQATD